MVLDGLVAFFELLREGRDLGAKGGYDLRGC